MQITTPKCYVRSDVEKLSNYRDPEHAFHRQKAMSRDPDGVRSPQEGFWRDCVFFAHREISRDEGILKEDVLARFVDMATATLHDVRGRPRPRTIKLGVYNPPSEIQAKLRALPPAPRVEVISKAFRHFEAVCAETLKGPMIIWSHPDKIRMHFELLALLFDPATRRKFPWGKGLRVDGAGTTTFAELESKDHPLVRSGYNSDIAGKMARFIRERLREIEAKMTAPERDLYEKSCRLQHVIFELTLHDYTKRTRIFRDHQRPRWLGRLVAAWEKAPGAEKIEAKINGYLEQGLVDSRGLPFVVPAFSGAGRDYLSVVKEAAKSSGSSGELPPARESWLNVWIHLLQHERKRKSYIKKKGLGAASKLFIFPPSGLEDAVLFNGSVHDEIEKSPSLTAMLYGRPAGVQEHDGVREGISRKNIDPARG